MTNIAAQDRTTQTKPKQNDLEVEERGRDHKIKEEQIVILLPVSKLLSLSMCSSFSSLICFFYKGMEKGGKGVGPMLIEF